jgi:septation ring formation regulator EzrA
LYLYLGVMTEREDAIVKELKGKINRLIELHLKVKNENTLLNVEVSSVKERVRELTLQNEELLKKHENLKFAKSLVGVDEDSRNAKNKINKIVREIDQCIAMLNK